MDRRTFNRMMALGSLGGTLAPARMVPGAFPEPGLPVSSPGARGKRLPAIEFDRLCYRIEGKPTYLYSGEFHYFRVPKADWRKRMELFKEAGGNCVATYIPWLIHEPTEGVWPLFEEPLLADGSRARIRLPSYARFRPAPFRELLEEPG